MFWKARLWQGWDPDTRARARASLCKGQRHGREEGCP